MEMTARDPWITISRNGGYSEAFLRQAKESRARAVRLELVRKGLSTLRHQGMPEWARMIVKDVGERRGICPSDIAGPSRVRKISMARNEAIYLIKASKPVLSCVQLAKWFDRDHTSILYSIASHQERERLPRLAGYDVAAARMRKRDWARQKRSQSTHHGAVE